MHPKRFVELSPDELCRAIEATYECTAHFEYWQHVEVPYGPVWWLGGVGVFRLVGHPDAGQCYGWSWSANGTEHRQIFTVLQVPPITNARDAVSTTLAVSDLPAKCPP